MRLSSVLALSLLAGPALAARRAEVPPPGDLLSLALHPTASYRAKGRVQFFAAATGKAKTQAFSMSAAPGGRYHKEFAPSAKKPAALILASDGKRWSLLHVRPGTLWTGPVLDDEAAQAKLLRELYELSSSTSGVVARRSTWRLDFREKKSGALRRSWWLDRKTGAVLRREQYRADGSLWRRERCSRFEEDGAGVPALPAPPGPARPWTEPGGLRRRPEGFVPLEYRREGTQRVYGYGDGLASLTLTRSSSRAAAPRLAGVVARPAGGLAMGWSCGLDHCLLEGEVLEDELRLAAASVEASR